MRKHTMILPVAILVLGTIAMATGAEAQGIRGSSVCQAVKNFTPYIGDAACNGKTGYCGCGPGWITSCAPHCCKCVRCH